MTNPKISIVSVKSNATLNSSITTVQEESSKLEDLKKPCFPYRSLVAIFGIWGAVTMFAVRCMLSVAIVVMTSKEDKSEILYGDNSTSVKRIPFKKTLDFTNEQQGVILGSYFYSYTALQAVGGLLADKFDVVWLNIVCHSVSAFLTFITPFAAELGVWYFVLVRILMGAAHSAMLASLYTLFARWFPPSEMSLPICLQIVGCNLGIALVMPFTAWFSEQDSLGGWPMSFHVMGITSFTVPIFYFLFVSSSPGQNRWVSEYEKKYLMKENPSASGEKTQVHIAWASILRSKVVWGIILGKVGVAFGYMTINIKIPSYLEDQLKMSLKDNGMLNAFMYILLCTAQFICGPALLVPAAALITIPMIGDNKLGVISMLLLAMTAMGANTGGDMPIISEIAPDCSGTIFGVTNTAASSMGFLAPMVTGYLLDTIEDKTLAWNLTFFIGGGLMVMSAICFNLLASANPQTWGLAKSRYNKALNAVGQRAPRLNPNTPGPVFSRHSIAY